MVPQRAAVLQAAYRAAAMGSRICAGSTPPDVNPASALARPLARPRATAWRRPGFRAAATTWTGNLQSAKAYTRRFLSGSSNSPSARPHHPRPIGQSGNYSSQHALARPCLQQQQQRKPSANRVVGWHRTKAAAPADRRAKAPAITNPENANAPADRRPAGRCGGSRQSVVWRVIEKTTGNHATCA